MPAAVYYNDFEEPQAIIDLRRLHVLCRCAQVSFKLEFMDGPNLWCGEIVSSIEQERVMTSDRSLSSVLDLIITALTRIK